MNQFLDQLNADIRSSYCEHTELDYEYETVDGYTVLVGAICQSCDKDLIEMFSDSERLEMGQDEQAYQADVYYDSLKEDGYVR